METPREDVCFICKRTAYITKCKGCLYNNLKKKGSIVKGAEKKSLKRNDLKNSAYNVGE